MDRVKDLPDSWVQTLRSKLAKVKDGDIFNKVDYRGVWHKYLE